MSQFVMVDLLFMALAVAAVWAAHYMAQPPPSEGGTDDTVPRPLLATGASIVSWSGTGFDIQQPKPLDETLRRICNSSGYSGIETFIEGARLAYEGITNAFVCGDLAPQRSLLSDEVHELFSEVIAQRSARGETMESTLIGVGCDIVGASHAHGQAWIDVRFVATMTSATRNAAGQVTAGHPNRVIDVAEIWTFERDLRAADPNWILTATEADD